MSAHPQHDRASSSFSTSTSANYSSRPSTSHSSVLSHSYPVTAWAQQRSEGVAISTSMTYQKLGFVSPVYVDRHARGQATSHGILGGIGYTSSPHLTLTPALPQPVQQPRGQQSAAAGHQRNRAARGSSSARMPRRLSQQDLQYLKENEERNRQVFKQWLQSKAEEVVQEHKTPEETERRRQEELEQFLEREAQLKQESAAKVREWQTRKAAQARLEAMHWAVRQQEARQLTAHRRMRAATAQAVNRERETRFLVRTGPLSPAPKQAFFPGMTPEQAADLSAI